MADDVIPITRAEYEAKFGGASQAQDAIPITRAEYQAKFGMMPEEQVNNKARLSGILDAQTSGLADEIYGYGNAALDTLTGKNKSLSFGQKADVYTNAMRGAMGDARDAAPVQGAIGNVVGGFLNPLTYVVGPSKGIIGAAKTGAILGAAYGAGSGEGGAKNRAEQAVKSGAIGGVASGVIAGAGKAVSSTGEWLGEQVPKLRGSALGATKTDFKASAKYKGLINGPEGKTTKLEQSIKNVIDDGTFKGAKSTDDFLVANTSKLESYDDALSEVLSKIDDSISETGAKVTPSFANAEKFVAQANPLEKPALQKELEQAKSLLLEAHDGTLSGLQTIKRSLYRSVYSENGRAKQELATKLAQDMKDSIEAGAALVTGRPEAAQAIKQLNAKMGQHLEVEKLLARKLATEQASDVVKELMGNLRTSGGNLTTPTIIGRATGGEAGGKLGFLGGALLNRLATPKGKMGLANVLEKTAPAIKGAGSPVIGAAPRLGLLGANQLSGSVFNKGKQMDEVKPPAIEKQEISAIVDKVSGGGDMAKLVNAVIRAESNGKVDAQSKVGAQGLMQLMPAMQKALGVKDAFDAEQNITGGVALLSEELQRFKDVKLALAAYNAGSPKVMAAIKKAGSTDWEAVAKHLPAETQNYVPKVLKFVEV